MLAEPLDDKAGTKHLQEGKFSGVKGNVSGMGNVSCPTSAFMNASPGDFMNEKDIV